MIYELNYYDFRMGEWCIEYHLGFIAKLKAHHLERNGKIVGISLKKV